MELEPRTLGTWMRVERVKRSRGEEEVAGGDSGDKFEDGGALGGARPRGGEKDAEDEVNQFNFERRWRWKSIE